MRRRRTGCLRKILTIMNPQTAHRFQLVMEESLSACPFCLSMLDDGAKALGVDEKLARKDIAELVVEAL